MDRVTIYPGQIPLETDLLQTQRNVMSALGLFAQDLLGTSTQAAGFTCIPTSPASLGVQLTPGRLYSLQNVDGSAYSSLPIDSHQIVKQGILLDAVTLSTPAPSTAGQSINYLIQVAYQDVDSAPVTLPYYNASNPTQAYYGPNNSAATQPTRRGGNVVAQAKAGTAATTGTQTTPTADAGFLGLFFVTVANGASTVTSGQISSLGISAGNGAALVGVQDAGNFYPGATKTLEAIAATIGLQSTFVTYDTTGAVDAASTIQAAIDAVDSYKTAFQLFTKVIYLPAGKCKIGTSILHRNGVIIVGERGCELYPTGNFPAILQSANTAASGSRTYSSLGVRGISIVGTNGSTNNAGAGLLNGSLSNQHGIQLNNDDQFNSASYLYIENCFIYSCGGNGLYVHKPVVSNVQFGWTQFGHLSDLTIQGCGGWGIYVDSATSSTTGADFASMETYRIHVQGNYAGGVYIIGGNDNKLRFTVNNTGTCVSRFGTFTNPIPGPSIQIEGSLNSQLWCHIENNNSGEGLVIGRTVLCYTTKVEGLFYNLAHPIRLDKVNAVGLNHLHFGLVPVGNYCIETTSTSRYVHVEREWYKDTATSFFLSDGNAGSVFAATGYIGINAIGLGPTSQIYSGVNSTNGDAIGYGTGSGVSVTQATSKATTVTCNAVTGQITTFNDSLAANTTVVFAANCNKVAVGDTVGINISSGPGSPQAYIVRAARVGAGFFVVAIKNDTAGALAETLVLNFTVTKGAIA